VIFTIRESDAIHSDFRPRRECYAPRLDLMR